MEVKTIGIDLAKSVFQLHGVDGKGRPLLRKRLTREKVLPFYGESAALRSGDGSVRFGALLGA
jgi:transposase